MCWFVKEQQAKLLGRFKERPSRIVSAILTKICRALRRPETRSIGDCEKLSTNGVGTRLDLHPANDIPHSTTAAAPEIDRAIPNEADTSSPVSRDNVLNSATRPGFVEFDFEKAVSNARYLREWGGAERIGDLQKTLT